MINKILHFLENAGKALEKKAVSKNIAIQMPEELHLELTYKCNSKCVMCNLRYINSKEKELTSEELMKVFQSKLLGGIKFIVLSGGEPMLRNDFIDIVSLAARNFPSANILILSNYLNTKLLLKNLENIRSIVDLKRISLGTSIDGLGLRHDRIRGARKGFNALVNSLNLVKNIYPQVYQSLNFTITPKNCDQILPVYDWCKKNGLHVSFQVMVQKNETKKLLWNKKHILMVEKQLSKVISDICRTNSISGPESLYLNKGLLSLLLSLYYIPKYIKERKRYFPNCPCGEKFAMIDPFGTLYFCPVHKDKTAGSLKNNNLDALWVTSKAEEARKFFNKKKCHCWLTCSYSRMLGDAVSSI